jgi:WG containing repeat
MNRIVLLLHAVMVVLFYQSGSLAESGDVVFGVPEAAAVEYSPGRHVDPIGLLPIEVDGRWGYADRRGDVVVEPRYEWVDYIYGPIIYGGSQRVWISRYLYEGEMGWMVFYGRKRGDSGMVKANEYKVYPGGGGAADRYVGGFVVMGRGSGDDRRYSMMESGGDWLTQPNYTGMLRVVDGFAAVETDGLCGYIDKRGKVTIPLQFSEARSFRDGMAAVRQTDSQGGGWGFIDKRGKFSFLDKAGEIEELRNYHEGLAGVKVRGKWGFLDKRQRGRVNPIYDEVRDFAGGCAAVRRGTEWGYIDVTGKELAWGFDGAWRFEDESLTGAEGSSQNIRTARLGLVRDDGGYGYVDRTGQVKIEPRYQNALPFFRGLARVKCGESFAYINPQGRVVWDPRRVARYGINGLEVAPAVGRRWSGLPTGDGAWGEPYPFEYEVEDHLPFTERRPRDVWGRED